MRAPHAVPARRHARAAVPVARAVALVLAALAGPLAVAAASAPAAPGPGAVAVQAAYDDARVVNAERHAYDLVIESAKCNAMKAGGYACQIDFVRKDEPDRRLYFDVVTLDERAGRWALLSGLCVKKNPPAR
jgi:hypothetical protein